MLIITKRKYFIKSKQFKIIYINQKHTTNKQTNKNSKIYLFVIIKYKNFNSQTLNLHNKHHEKINFN